MTIYLDYQATTPLAPEAAAAMRPWLDEKFANPHSPHKLGREAAATVEVARAQLWRALGTDVGLPIFTSGATEAANLAIQGALRASDRRTIVTLTTEHACVLDTALAMERRGFRCKLVPVDGDGLVDLDAARRAIDGDTALVAAMLVNNEIGTIQPIAELAGLAHAAGALFFCDAVQGLGRVDLPIDQCDMVVVSSHKIHGPKGIGALWVREGVLLEPIIFGGGQEAGIRSGTLSPELCAGFGAAAALTVERREADRAHVEKIAAVARRALGGWTLNGSSEHRYPGNLNLRRAGVDADRLVSEVREVAFSVGSACASGSGRPSHVLIGLGLTGGEARSSIRLGFGRYTTEAELSRACAMIDAAAARQDMLAA